MGWGAAVLVKDTGFVLACRKWPGFILLMFPLKTKFASRKYFQYQAQRSWQPGESKILCITDCTEGEGKEGATELRAAHFGCFGCLHWVPQHLDQGAANNSGSSRVQDSTPRSVHIHRPEL